MLEPGLAPRRAALRALEATRRGTPLDVALTEALGSLSDQADRRLAHELAAGVLRRRAVLDAQLAPLAKAGWQRVPPALQDILRLGAYQLVELDRVPVHAAVDTAVALAREIVGARSAGFVNAVLRRVATGAPSPTPAAREGLSARLARKHSHPEWLVTRWLARFGRAEAAELLAWNDRRPALVLQPLGRTPEVLADTLVRAGIAARPAPFDAGVIVEGGGRVAELPGYREGEFLIQDPAQAMVVRYAQLPPDTTLVDACAAPGGKTLGLAAGVRRIVAGDLRRRRLSRLRENLARTGTTNVFPVLADAAHLPVRRADAVLLDAPCLGTGTFARHPEARWRVEPGALPRLAAVQAALLREAAEAVRPGGLLVYATCSLEPEENEEQVEALLRDRTDYRREPPAGPPLATEVLSAAGDLTLLPQRHGTDGAYAARLRRAEQA